VVLPDLMPFCVSSFSQLIKGKGFVLVFPPSAHENLAAPELARHSSRSCGW
jgi:hypothetical protein